MQLLCYKFSLLTNVPNKESLRERTGHGESAPDVQMELSSKQWIVVVSGKNFFLLLITRPSYNGSSPQGLFCQDGRSR